MKDVAEYWQTRRQWEHDLNKQDEEEFVSLGLPRVEILHRAYGSSGFANEIIHFRDPETNSILLTQTFVQAPSGAISPSLHCKQHGCRMMIASHKCPDRMAIRFWVASGKDIGSGAAFNDEHVKEMRRLLGRD